MHFLYQNFKEELSLEESIQISDGLIDIRGEKFSAFEILKLATKEGQTDSVCNRVFNSWKEEYFERKCEEADIFLEDFGCRERFELLVELCRNNAVIPFVGAGMSRPSGYPLWSDFLHSQRRNTEISKDELDRLLSTGLYEEAAEKISNAVKGPAFTEAVESTFGIDRKICGPISLIPHIFKSHVATTNFDTLLERCHRGSGLEFSQTICGTSLKELRRLINNGKSLIKLHGKADSEDSRVLTATEYQKCYPDGDGLNKVLGYLHDQYSFLFLGCSLTTDRTLAAVKAHVLAHGHTNLPRHYAFLPAPESEAARIKRRQDLVDFHIYPIWYPPNSHDDSISALLIKLWSSTQ